MGHFDRIEDYILDWLLYLDDAEVISIKTLACQMKAASLKANNPIMMDPRAVIQPAAGNVPRSNSCTSCYQRLIELKKQAMKHMMIEYHQIIVGAGVPSLENLLLVVYQNLKLTEHHSTGLVNNSCTYCGVNVEFLKKHALLALQTANFTPLFTKSMMTLNQNDILYNEVAVASRPTATHGEASDTVNGRRVQGLNTTVDISREMTSSKDNYARATHATTTTTTATSPAPTTAQFFAEAAKKFNIPSKKKSKKSSRSKSDSRLFPTDFSSLIKTSPPPNPPGLFKYMGRRVDGKVSVMLRISQPDDVEQSDSLLEVDQRRKQVSIQQPKNPNFIPPKLQTANNAVPKLFGFDAIFEPEMLPSRVSSSSLLDVLHAVVNGGEGCLLVYGAAGVGKSSTMVGNDESNRSLGVIPAAVAWLYSLIEDCKQRTGARISVRVSAVEVIGQNEQLKDLLSEQATGGDSTDSTGASPGIYLREDPIGGTVQLGNVSEPQAVSAEKAAFYLDAALAARTTDKELNSHMIFTVHVYQYRVEKNQRRGPGGAVPYSGGRSRLHLIDLSCFNSNFDQMQNGAAPSHAGLGQIIVAMLNGFKQVPYKDSKITRLLKDSIGNSTCRTTLVAHVSAEEKNYAKTLSTLQTVSKIQRSRRKRNKYCGTSSDNTSCDEARGGRRRPNPAIVKTYGIDDSNMSSDYNTSSAGEDSCDTVIYMGNNGRMSDRDLSDNERPPSPNTFRAMKLKLTSSSEDEQSELTTSESLIVELNEKLAAASTQQHQKTVNADESQSNYNVLDSSINDSTNREKHINIVPPLVIQDNLQTDIDDIDTDNTLEENETPKISLADELTKNEKENEDELTPTPPGGEDSDEKEEQYKAPSEKELRRREKRIAKLLKETMSDDEVPALVSFNNRKNKTLGYTSDNEVVTGNIRRKHDKQDGYISAPENNRAKPVQVVKGVVRQRSNDDTPQDLNKIDVNKNRDFLRAWVQNELMKHLREMETMKTSLDSMSNSMEPLNINSAKDSKIEDAEEAVVETIMDNLATPEKDLHTSNLKEQFDVGASPDSMNESLPVDTSTPNKDDMIFPLETIGSPVNPPCIDNSFLKSNNLSKLPSKEWTDNACAKYVQNLRTYTENIEGYGNTTTFGIEPSDDVDLNDENSIFNENVYNNSNSNDSNNNSIESSVDADVPSSSPKIQNLNHVITISAIPNFSVTNKEPTLNQLISSPKVQRNTTRNANIANTKYYKGSMTSVDQEWNRPVFERSYSKEDTCSLVSVNESDAYDSDHYCSSYTSYNPSPAVERKQQQKRPTRLKYRWSTVFEEDENKKEKTSTKNSSISKTNKNYLDDNDLKNISCVSPKSSRSASKSPKKEKDRRTRSVDSCPETPQGSSKCSDSSLTKTHKKFQLLSPRSDRRMKDSASENKRNSGCSDASSGIGSSSSQSQSSSLHSNEDILTDEVIVEKETPPKSKYWPFSRSKSRKSYRSPSGYMSDGHITDSHRRRHSRLFGSRSKSMVYNDGHSSGYDTSITEGGMTSCNEDALTDTEGGRSKKKKRFLGFRRRSTNDLNTSRGRYKKPIWLDGRRCQSDDEDVRIKVYNIDEPRRLDRQICKSENAVSPRFQLRRIEELKKERGVLKSEQHLGLDKFQSLLYTAPALHRTAIPYGSSDIRSRSSSKIEDQFSLHGDHSNSAIGRKLRTLKNHIQVVTCFDGHASIDRKVTRI